MDPLIAFEHVSKQFSKGGKGVQALKDVDVSVQRGEFVAVVGPSGCGKSTLLNMAAGLMRPSSGQVRYKGVPVSEVNTSVGYVTQRDNLLPWRNVRSNIAIGLEIRATPQAERETLVKEIIDKVGLSGFEEHYPGELSGGMRKRASLARTIIYSPETLLMDEPFGALDAQLKLVLQQELLQLWETSGSTIIFVTHDLGEAVTLADRVVVISARPGYVKLIQEIDLPRPRDVFRVRFNERFVHLNQLIWDTMQGDFQNRADF